MPQLSELKWSYPPSLLIFGPPGTGKTLWPMSGGELVQVLDLDLGIRSALTFQDKWTATRLKCDVVSVEQKFSINQGQLANPVGFQQSMQLLVKIADLCGQKKYPWKILVVDSLSMLAEFSLRQVLASPMAVTKGGARQDGRAIYGVAMENLSTFLTIFRSLPLVKVLIAHDQRDVVTDVNGTQSDIIEIATYGKKFPAEIPRYFDDVMYSQLYDAGGGVKKHRFRTIRDEHLTVRTRNQLPDFYKEAWDEGILGYLDRIGHKLS